MQPELISRRHFLVTGGIFVAGLTPCVLGAAAKGKISLALELCSVGRLCEKDLPGTLQAIRKIGYRAVEFDRYYGHDAKTLKGFLDDAGLQCCGTHIRPFEALLGDRLEKTAEFSRTVGSRYLIVPGLPEKYRATAAAWHQSADLFSEMAGRLKPWGMTVGYHNESMEFRPFPGTSESPWESFFRRASEDVVIQYDIGNASAVGADARVYLKKFPGRVVSVHVKPFSKSHPDALIGQDELPWPEIFDLCETVAGVKWYIIEYERKNQSPLDSVEKLYGIMRDFGKG